MIITRTPLRVSFVGGGTDLPEYYENSTIPGRVISTTIDKYVYIALNKKFDGRIRVSYSTTENVDTIGEIQHDIVRNTLKEFSIFNGIEIVSIADIPGTGSGLGASSAFTVGLIKAIMEEYRIVMTKREIAEMAYDIERNLCGKILGKQDQYASTFGGLNMFLFFKDDVVVRPIKEQSIKVAFQENLQMFYLMPRKKKDILVYQARNTPRRMEILDAMSMLALGLYTEARNNPATLGQFLDINWEYKRQLADGISDNHIQEVYQKAMAAGSDGGKVLGQGGGGFMLFHSKPAFHQSVKTAVGLKYVPFKFTDYGVEVIYVA